MKITNRISCILLFCLLMTPLDAQETKVVRDLGLWTGVGIEKSFKKDWTFSLEQEFRFSEDISLLKNYFTEAGIRYRINRNFALTGKYRFTRHLNKKDIFENRTRYSFDLRYKGKLDFITIAYRLRYQKEVEGANLLDPMEPYEKYLRNKLKISYNDLRKIKPYISAEIFRLYEMYQPSEFHYYRVLAGVRYSPGNFGEFNLAYGINHELNSTTPATLFTIRVNYIYAF